MLGPFATIDLARRALLTQQTGIEVTGNNLANVANPSYARQRAVIATSPALLTNIGTIGTGADPIAIQQIRSVLLDNQIVAEAAVTGYLGARQNALQYTQTNLGEQVSRTDGTASSTFLNGLADGLNQLFNAFQSLSTDPRSLAERTVLLGNATELATRFGQTAQRLDDLRSSLNDALTSDVTKATDLLDQIASLNAQITRAEAGGGMANDLRDLRQEKLESLAQLAPIATTTAADGTLSIALAGTQLVSGDTVLDQLATFDAGNGQLLLRTATGGVPLALTGGAMQGYIETRDGELASLSADLDTLANQLITQINAVHATGFDLAGNTGTAFFVGTDARTIAVNATLKADPSLIQASGLAGGAGDNQVALRLAQLATTPQAALGNQTFSAKYAQMVSSLGQSLAGVNAQLDNQQAIASMLAQQRDSVSGVSLDEETTNLIKFQRAYQASSRVISVMDELLETLVNLR